MVQSKIIGFDDEVFDTTDAIQNGMRGNIASDFISKLTDYAEKSWGWRPLSRQSVCAEIAYQWAISRQKSSIYRRDYDSILLIAQQIGLQSGFKALTFSRNENGRRIPMNNADAAEAFRKQISAVKDDVNKRLAKMDRHQDDQRDIEDDIEEEQEQEFKQKEKKKEKKDERSQLEIDGLTLRDWIWTTGVWCDQRNADGHNIDSIGMRPFVDGAKMLSAGIPTEAIKYAITMHWPDEARKSCGVTEYDVTTFKPENRIKGMHSVMPYCMAIVEQRIPLCLIGKSGVGKTTLAANIADQLGIQFGFVSMTRGTSPSAFNGRPRIADDGSLLKFLHAMATGDETEASGIVKNATERGDTIQSQFVKIYGGGGVYLFDELDAGDENLLLLVNAALANGFFANPATGEIVEKHPDFLAVAGMNTAGLGATRDHNARNRLDHATIDRWRAGRVNLKLDKDLAFNVFDQIIQASV